VARNQNWSTKVRAIWLPPAWYSVVDPQHNPILCGEGPDKLSDGIHCDQFSTCCKGCESGPATQWWTNGGFWFCGQQPELDNGTECDLETTCFTCSFQVVLVKHAHGSHHHHPFTFFVHNKLNHLREYRLAGAGSHDGLELISGKLSSKACNIRVWSALVRKCNADQEGVIK